MGATILLSIASTASGLNRGGRARGNRVHDADGHLRLEGCGEPGRALCAHGALAWKMQYLVPRACPTRTDGHRLVWSVGFRERLPLHERATARCGVR